MEQNINLNLFRSEFLGTQLLLNGTLLLPTPTDVIFAPPPYSCRVLRKWMRRIRRHSSIYSYRLSDSVSRFHVWIRSRSTYGLSTVYSRSAYVPLTVHLRSTHGPPTVHPWSTHGPPTVHPQTTYGPLTAHLRSTHGPLTVHELLLQNSKLHVTCCWLKCDCACSGYRVWA